MIHLYHGSTVDIKHIDLEKSRPIKTLDGAFICLKTASKHGEWVSSRH